MRDREGEGTLGGKVRVKVRVIEEEYVAEIEANVVEKKRRREEEGRLEKSGV